MLAWQRLQKIHMYPETYFADSTSCIKWKIKPPSMYCHYDLHVICLSYHVISSVIWQIYVIRSSQLNYKDSVYKSIWVSEQHSRFTMQKVKQLHSISSLNGNIFIQFSFPSPCHVALLFDKLCKHVYHTHWVWALTLPFVDPVNRIWQIL